MEKMIKSVFIFILSCSPFHLFKLSPDLFGYLDRECLKEADLILDNHREIGLYIQNAEKNDN